MQFKTKDLTVSLGPAIDAKICVWHTTICVNPSLCRYPTLVPCFQHTSLACCAQHTCFGITRLDCTFTRITETPCNPTPHCPGSFWRIEDPEDLVVLKRELTEVLGQLENIDVAGLGTGLTTRAQAEAAEKALTEALEQVRAQKKTLK